jgi:murein L,D-transpeptidase YafK
MQIEKPQIILYKKSRELELFDGDRLVKIYKISLGKTPAGDKEIEGDGKTPEGEFYVFTKNEKSKFHLSLALSYPNIEDADRGLMAKLITKSEHQAIIEAITEKKMPPQNTKLGGEIYIHGGGAGTDWTQGCVALADDDIKELFDSIPVGTTVRILP